jgi:transcriptional regulator with GAF, ATPase, and Fis domain
VPSYFPLAEALTVAVQEIDTRRELPEILQALLGTAQPSLPGVDHVGISVTHSDRQVETLAATDDLVQQLDKLQYQLNEGPCLDAIRQDGVVVVSRAELEARWPSFMDQAAMLGLRSQMSLRLYVETETLGGLNLYSTQADHIDRDVQHIAQMFAWHAALALGKARFEEAMSVGMASRQRIGQAVGILMERYELVEDRAFAYLARVLQTSNIKLREVADEVVDSCNDQNRLPERRPLEGH